jgi:hypothetical protein
VLTKKLVLVVGLVVVASHCTYARAPATKKVAKALPAKAPPVKAAAPIATPADEASADAAKIQRAFIYLEEPRLVGGDPAAADFGRILVQVARSRLQATDGVALRTSGEMPEVAKTLARRGDLTQLDRVALVAVRNESGFDGIVSGDYRLEKGELDLTLRYIDCGNGRVFAVRRIKGPVSAGVFGQMETDLTEFAATLRQTYRVTLRVDSSPAGAEVRINGAIACRTPCKRELIDGTYEVVVTKQGYKPWRHREFYKSGDRAHLVATLYNPVAERYLNREPAWRLDSHELGMGYRYSFFNLSRPNLRELHVLTLEYLLRVSGWEAGVSLRFGPSADVSTTFDTFVPRLGARRVDGYRFISPMALMKRMVFEKFSFLSLWVGLAAGFTNARTEAAALWSFSTDAFVEIVSRLSRSRNFSFEVKMDLGFTYLGQLPYIEKRVSLFGDGPERTRLVPLLGPFVGVALRLVGWNDIF